jgi:hypothetical protein
MTNDFYKRMWKDNSENGFRKKAERRWQELRSTLITHSGIMDMFLENQDYLYNNGVYEREKIAWSGFDPAINNHFTYMSGWLERRLEYLDGVFNYDPTIVPPSFIDTPDPKEKINVYPNPVTDYLHIESGMDDAFNIRIYTINGQLVLSSRMDKTKDKLWVKELKAGIYFIRMYNDEINEVKKIIIQ